MSSATQQQRELYAVNRSEATWLVNTYMDALEKGADGSIEPSRVFRDSLETMKPAYLGKFNNSHNALVQGTFYKIASNLYNMLNELNRRVSDTDHHQKTMDAAKLLPCKHVIAYLTGSFLNWAVYNWHMKTSWVNVISLSDTYNRDRLHASYPTNAENIDDYGYECNTCSVCYEVGESWFYFSTAFGLEKPVCENCMIYDDYAPTEKDKKNDPDYEVSEEESEAEEEYEAQNEVVVEKDPDYVPSDESDCEEEYAEDSDDDLESSATKETDLSASYSYSSETGESDCESESESDASETGESDCESEKVFGCDSCNYEFKGCNYEFKAGFKYGYRTAMKKVGNYADYHKHTKPVVPKCARCELSHEKLKKCGRCQLVRYCSEECQAKDWPSHKRVCRREE